MRKKYIIKLTETEQNKLVSMVRKGTESARKLNRARMLILAHERKTDAQIVQSLGVGMGTVFNIRRRCASEGLERALEERARPGIKPKFDGTARAKITALACSTPPEGRGGWTLRLLADHAVRLELVDSIAADSVHRILKKTNLNRI